MRGKFCHPLLFRKEFYQKDDLVKLRNSRQHQFVNRIFDEEKNVVEKVPVDEVKMDDLASGENEIEKKKIKSKNFILVISDFYYLDSANNLKKELLKKTKMSNILVKKINNKKYRLLVGPFKNFNALKTTYISLNNLGFESLNVYNE